MASAKHPEEGESSSPSGSASTTGQSDPPLVVHSQNGTDDSLYSNNPFTQSNSQAVTVRSQTDGFDLDPLPDYPRIDETTRDQDQIMPWVDEGAFTWDVSYSSSSRGNVFSVRPRDEQRPNDISALPVEPSQPLGRRAIIKGDNPLISFVKKGKAPKHEYYQVMMIRALKKAIRSSFSDRKLPSGGIFKSLKMTPKAIQKWATFKKVVLGYSFLEGFAATVTGPATDGKSKRTQEENTEFSSFNKKYIQKFFSHQEVRTVHYYFIEWVFQASPEQLCEAMKFKCCTQATHTEACEQKWSGLKRYTQEGMIEEVGWTPYLQQ